MVGLLHTPPPPAMVLVRYIRCPSIPLSAPYGLFSPLSSSRMGAPESPPQPRLGAPLFHSRLFASIPFGRCSAWMGCSAGFGLLDPHRHSFAWICTLQFHSALLHHHQHSPGPPRTPHQAFLLSWRRTSFPPKFLILPFKLHFDPPRANLNSNLLDITNRAKWHWNSISPTRQAQIIPKYKERLHLLCTVDELCVPALVGPDHRGDVLDDIETMFDWYHSDYLLGLLFRIHLYSFSTHLPFPLVLLDVVMQTIECWWDAVYYCKIEKLIMNNSLCIIRRGYSYCSSTTPESQITPAVRQMNIHQDPASLRVSLGFPHWLGNSPRCSLTSCNRSHGDPVPVIRDPGYSNGRPECPPRVWFSPAVDASKFTLGLLSDTAGGSQWLKCILLMNLWRGKR